jgi:enoyl-CoA hydratase/carnithine racemase
MGYETILLEKKNGIAYLTLNRPERANTISAQLAHDVLGAVDDVEADAQCRVIIVTGAGPKHFCGGADLRDPALMKAGAFPPRDFMSAMEASRVPIIAAINGAAMGGGCEIALACDLRVIADTASIGVPEIKFGALPAGGGTQRLPRLVGPGVAKEMIFTGLPLTAAEALRVGLVNRVVPAAELMGACEELARVLIDRAHFALKTAKILVNRSFEVPLNEGLKLERDLIRGMATAEERRNAQQQAAASQTTYARIFKDRS